MIEITAQVKLSRSGKIKVLEHIQLLDAKIIRLAKEYTDLPICPANQKEHIRIVNEQCDAISEQRHLKKLLK